LSAAASGPGRKVGGTAAEPARSSGRTKQPAGWTRSRRPSQERRRRQSSRPTWLRCLAASSRSRRPRLARSQSAFGNVLLNLLSSGKVDEQTWEQIEDTLITADMGVGPARQL